LNCCPCCLCQMNCKYYPCFNQNWTRQYKCSGCNQIVAYKEAK
jgi:hypothetical protein